MPSSLLIYVTIFAQVFGHGYLIAHQEKRYTTVKYALIGNDFSEIRYDEFLPWTKINSLNNITKIAAGKSHVIVLNDEGAVFFWGTHEDKLPNDDWCDPYHPIQNCQLNPVKLENFPKK